MISVLPSDLEGLSLALLDAMGAGLCVLASDVPENREAVDYVGFTLPRGDVACLTDRLQFLIANPVVRETGEQRRNGGFAIIYPWSTVTANQFISRWGEGIP